MAALIRHRGRFANKKVISIALARNNTLKSATYSSRHEERRQVIRHDHTYCSSDGENLTSSRTTDPISKPALLDVSNDWTSGRRIVHLHHMAVQLEKGCDSCSKELRLVDIVKEKRCGLGCFYTISCRHCNTLTSITTDKRHCAEAENVTRSRIWDVNTKLSLGMLQAGLGYSSVTKLLAALNIPTMAHSTLKTREREVGPVIEALAESSCQREAEKELSETTPVPDVTDGDKAISVSFDGGWQKRGSGHSYNSLSGHACMIGKENGQIVAYDVRCKQCRICNKAKRDHREPSQHDCRKNWSGSSKAMESNMCVSMLKTLKKKGVKVGTLIMDEDSTSIAKARTEVDASIKKASDANHLKKAFTSKLYVLSKQHRQLTSTVISHITKSFMYALKQNGNDAAEIKTNLSAIVPHLFGEHVLCNVKWCGFIQSPDTYVPKHLPYKRSLTDMNLKSDLTNLLEGYARNSHKLTELGSSQRNESFNHVVASKNPKSQHYSGSESTCFRVATAVVDTNIGQSFVTKVNEQMFLSPGSHTQLAADKTDRKRKKQREMETTSKYKHQRLCRKETLKQDTSAKEIREGLSYRRGVQLCTYEAEDLQEIPQPVTEPTLQQIQPGEYEEVMFDLETTGLGHCDIVQLAAVSLNGETFNRYVSSLTPMTLEATKVTGISTQNGKVFKNGEEVPSSTLKDCLKDFNRWLQTFKKKVVLIAHNASFDSSVLMSACERIKFYEINDNVAGFLDTLKMFKHYFPNLNSYRQESLVLEVLQKTYNAHDALEDCLNLINLYKHTKNVNNLHFKDILQHSSTLEYVKLKVQHTNSTSRHLDTLSDMINKAVLTKFMAKKIASSGLSLQCLQLAFKRDKELGLKSLFGEKVNGKCRVTSNKKILDKCKKYLENS